MSANDVPTSRIAAVHLLRREDVLAGLLFIAVAAIGLWASRNYPIGTTHADGHRLRAAAAVLDPARARRAGVRAGAARATASIERGRPIWRAIVFAPLSLLVFALLIGPFGVVAGDRGAGRWSARWPSRESRPLEVAAAAVFLVVLTLAIFVWGVGLPIPVWPEW